MIVALTPFGRIAHTAGVPLAVEDPRMTRVSTSALAPRATVRRLWMWRVLTLLVGVLLPLGCLEALARILPVHGGTQRLAVNETNPVVRFSARSGVRMVEGLELLHRQPRED